MSNETAKLTDMMQEKYPSKLEDDGSQPLEAGVYHVTGFDIMDSEQFKKILKLNTLEGKFRTTSHSVVGSFSLSVGKLITEKLQTGIKSVEVEIVKKQANTGRWGIAVRAFEPSKPKQ